MKKQQNAAYSFVRQTLYSGSIAAIVMMPFGAFFTLMGLRINEYGLKVVSAIFGPLPNIEKYGLFAIEHFLISWGVAVPLLFLLHWFSPSINGLLIGLLYGAGFYIVVNALALPMVFGDPTPFALGFAVIYPSFIVHLVYGATIWFTSRDFLPVKE